MGDLYQSHLIELPEVLIEPGIPDFFAVADSKEDYD